MEYTKLGNSDLTVSRICMGCMGFGDASNGQHSWTLDEEHSREIIRYGRVAVLNFFDTVIAPPNGTSDPHLPRPLLDLRVRDRLAAGTHFLPPDN